MKKRMFVGLVMALFVFSMAGAALAQAPAAPPKVVTDATAAEIGAGSLPTLRMTACGRSRGIPRPTETWGWFVPGATDTSTTFTARRGSGDR
jgi:hypothetical protein